MKRLIVFILGLGIVSCTNQKQEQEKKSSNRTDSRPNIVVILADDLGYNDVSFNGATEIQTPEIDALANNGVIFKNGYVTHPYCGPSRAGLLTGRYQARFGLENNPDYNPSDPHMGLPITEELFPKKLQEAGYTTGMVGKWHIGAAAHFQPLSRGFDYFYGFLGGGHNYFPEEIDFRGDSYKIPLQENHGLGDFDEYLTTALSRKAAGFINENKDDPFFLYVAYNAPHAPLEAPAELEEKYKHIEDPERRTYLAMVDAMDQGIGMIVDALKDSGNFENTLIFFLSDNGGVYPEAWLPTFDWADNSPFRRGKVALLEGGVHVPFIAHWPEKIAKGQTFDGLVSALDIAATSMRLSEYKGDVSKLEGVDLLPYFEGQKADSPHKALYWRLGEGDPLWCIRTEKYKYMNQPLPGVGKCFFDLEQDPTEKNNLLGKYPEQQAELASLWNDWNKDNINMILHHGPHLYKPAVKKMYDALYEEQVQKANERGTYIVE